MPFYTFDNQYYIMNSSFYISYLLNINLQIPIANLLRKTSLRTWAAIFDRNTRSLSFICFLILPNPSSRMCVLTKGSFSFFGGQLKNHCELQVGSWFWFFFFGFRFLCLLKLFIRGTILWTPPPPQAPRRAPPLRGPSAGPPPRGPLAGGRIGR